MNKLIIVCVVLLGAIPLGAQLEIEPITLDLPRGEKLRAEIGTLRVPENRSRPDSRKIEIAFIRLRSTAAKPGSPIVWLAGGPGNSGTSIAESPGALAGWNSLTALADVIFLDQRSTGKSRPRISCPPTEPVPPGIVFLDREKTMQGLQKDVAACVAEWQRKGADLSGYHTAESADDLESLRIALGAKKLSLVAFSYGTHLALATMRRHPGSLDRVILLGTEGPDHTRKLPASSDTQLRKLSLLANEDLFELTRKLYRRLDSEPVTVQITDGRSEELIPVRVGSHGLQRILAADLGDGNDLPQIPALLKLTAAGDYSLLTQYVQKRYRQMNRGVGLMPLLMDCASGVTAARARQIETESASSIMSEINFPFPQVCSSLPIKPLPDDFRRPLVSAIPALFISGTLDNNTPPFQAEELRWGFTNATHLIVANAGHEDTLPNPAVQRVMADFLAGRDVSGARVALPPLRILTLDEARRLRLE